MTRLRRIVSRVVLIGTLALGLVAGLVVAGPRSDAKAAPLSCNTISALADYYGAVSDILWAERNTYMAKEYAALAIRYDDMASFC